VVTRTEKISEQTRTNVVHGKMPKLYYTCLFESLNDFAAENELVINPQFILTGFEKEA